MIQAVKRAIDRLIDRGIDRMMPYLRQEVLAQMGASNAALLEEIRRQRTEAPEWPRSVYLGECTALIKTVFNHWMFLDTRDRSLTPHLLFGGFWEDWIIHEIDRHIRPGMTVVDIGANCGFYTLFFADRVGPSGTVHAFEPNPRLNQMLSWSLSTNGFAQRTHLHGLAVGDREGRVNFRSLDRYHSVSSMFITDGSASALQDRAVDHAVDMASLDAVLGDAPIDIIKIDAEGAETQVIAGARNLLARNRDVKLIMEYAPPGMPGKIEEGVVLLQTLHDLGFHSYNIVAGKPLAPFSADEARSVEWAQLLLTRTPISHPS
ncbi:MAG TPA: FkbM family methyltransferase [Acetobacteraceae bacterium]|nr:FkbM family methyltransferase [Acetobacteraceae bacterium]